MAFNPPALQQSVSIVDKDGKPSLPFHIWWDNVIRSIKTQEDIQDATVAQLATVVSNLLAVVAQQNILVTQMATALASMPDVPDEHVVADYTGAPVTDELPRVVLFQRFTDTTDTTASSIWSFTVDSGSLTASFTNPGELTITGVALTSVVTVTSSLAGIVKTRTFTVYLDVSAPPVSSASDNALLGINSTVHSPISDELTVTVGASGTVTLTAPLAVRTGSAPIGATYKVYGLWQWWNGASWVDIGTEVSSNPDCSTSSRRIVNPGSLTVNQSKTGLTPGGSEKFRLEARKQSGTVTMNFIGTATATTS